MRIYKDFKKTIQKNHVLFLWIFTKMTFKFIQIKVKLLYDIEINYWIELILCKIQLKALKTFLKFEKKVLKIILNKISAFVTNNWKLFWLQNT